MTSQQVRKLVENEIGDGWETTNHHRVDLRRALVHPRKMTVIDQTLVKGKVRERAVSVWLVLEEQPASEEGYRIVMKEDEPVFGLAYAEFPDDKQPTLTGWYGDFMTAFRGM